MVTSNSIQLPDWRPGSGKQYARFNLGWEFYQASRDKDEKRVDGTKK